VILSSARVFQAVWRCKVANVKEHREFPGTACTDYVFYGHCSWERNDTHRPWASVVPGIEEPS
jgi:hypothetical protein